MQPIVSFAFIGVYCALLWRWSTELRNVFAPRLERYLDGRNRRRRASPDADRRRDSPVGAARVALLFVATFVPILGLCAAAHFHALSWPRANSLLIFSLLLPGLCFALAERRKRERW